MKKCVLAGAMVTALFTLPTTHAAELQSSEQKISYIMGLDVAARMEGLGYTLNNEAFLLGLKESAMESGRSLSNESLQQTMQEAQALYQQRQEEEIAKQGAGNQSEIGRAHV